MYSEQGIKKLLNYSYDLANQKEIVKTSSHLTASLLQGNGIRFENNQQTDDLFTEHVDHTTRKRRLDFTSRFLNTLSQQYSLEHSHSLRGVKRSANKEFRWEQRKSTFTSRSIWNTNTKSEPATMTWHIRFFFLSPFYHFHDHDELQHKFYESGAWVAGVIYVRQVIDSGVLAIDLRTGVKNLVLMRHRQSKR